MHNEHVNLFKALSHRSRLSLLELLAQYEEMSVTELTDAMPREGSTISRHLTQLNLHGLVDVRQDGQNRYYSLNLKEIREKLEDFVQKLESSANLKV